MDKKQALAMIDEMIKQASANEDNVFKALRDKIINMQHATVAPLRKAIDEATDILKKSNEKGVHQPSPWYDKKTGISESGTSIRNAKGKMGSLPKQEHQQVLSDLKQMPKPNLPKSEMKKVDPNTHLRGTMLDKAGEMNLTPQSQNQGGMQKMAPSDSPPMMANAKHKELGMKLGKIMKAKSMQKAGEKGINQKVSAKHLKGGMSEGGLDARVSKELGAHPAAKESLNEAKSHHKQTLSELKQMPKPNLPKSENMQKASANPMPKPKPSVPPTASPKPPQPEMQKASSPMMQQKPAMPVNGKPKDPILNETMPQKPAHPAYKAKASAFMQKPPMKKAAPPVPPPVAMPPSPAPKLGGIKKPHPVKSIVDHMHAKKMPMEKVESTKVAFEGAKGNEPQEMSAPSKKAIMDPAAKPFKIGENRPGQANKPEKSKK